MLLKEKAPSPPPHISISINISKKMCSTYMYFALNLFVNA